MRRLISARASHMVLALTLASCSRGTSPLPDLPPYKELGFSQALPAVRDQVRDAYDRLLEQPTSAARNGHLGMVLSAYGRNDAAELLFRRAHQLAPEQFRWPYYLAVALREAARYEEAAAAFRDALQVRPDYVPARIQLADVLLELGRLDESIATYRALTSEAPTQIEAWLGLGKALARRGSVDDSVAALQRAAVLGPQYGEIHYALASALAARGDEHEAARALDVYQQTARNRIRTPDPYLRDVIVLNVTERPAMARGDRHLAEGNYAEAAAAFRAALALNPKNPDAWGGLVSALAQHGRVDETGAAYEQALAAGVSYRRLHLRYGMALRAWQQLDPARDVLLRALQLDPHYADALLELGAVEMQRAEPDAAVGYLRRALEARPNDRRIMLSLARALNATRQYVEAAQHLERIVDDPTIDTALALRELALAYRGLNEPTRAVDALQRASQAKSDNAELARWIDATLAEWKKALDR